VLAVELRFDPASEGQVLRLWDRLSAAQITTLRDHTHRRHRPHVSYVVLRRAEAAAVLEAVEALAVAPPTTLHLHSLGTFPGGVAFLAPTVDEGLLARQRAVHAAVAATGAGVHEHYRPGSWVPHVTLAQRVRVRDLPALAEAVHAVLPMTVQAVAADLIDVGTGQRWALPHLV
jgi:2'-5' RNA ligase